MQQNFAARDNDAVYGQIGLAWPRRGLSRELMRKYWRNTHAMLASNISTFYHYWVYHLEDYGCGYWPAIPGVDTRPDEDPPFGIPECMFAVADGERGFTSPEGAAIAADEHNFAERGLHYYTRKGRSRTFVDYLVDGEPNGPPKETRFFALIRRRADVDSHAFDTYVENLLAPVLAALPGVLKVRCHLLRPYNDADTGGVSSELLPAHTYHAIMEIAFPDVLAIEVAFLAGQFRDTFAGQQAQFHTVHTIRVAAVYTMKRAGRRTLNGIFGAEIADIIRQTGAANLVDPAVQALVLRPGTPSQVG